MAKLYFRYGAVSSAKTLNLLAVAHNYRSQGKRVVIAKPKVDTRFGNNVIASRAGLNVEADILVSAEDLNSLFPYVEDGISCVLVDEAQFLPVVAIENLREVSLLQNVPVICYGLRTDFQRRLFPASQRLLELADSIEEVKTTCHYCNRKAIYNARLQDGQHVTEGPQVLLGADETYRPVCSHHYRGPEYAVS